MKSKTIEAPAQSTEPPATVSGKVRITDTTLRDGHQSLWATRMKTSEMLPIAEKLDQVGYWSLEVWGGATFDVALRFLNEDPWERLSELRSRVKKTRLQMLLRGQNIVGYHNYPDDLLEAFIDKAAERGIDIIRIFDALNDVRNLAKAIAGAKKVGKHAQGTLCYTISPIHTIKYYLERAREQKDEGIDSICIKDMAGILAPRIAYDLIKSLKDEIGLPVQLHCHASSGMAVATYLRAVEAGVSVLDTAQAPLAFATSQPAVETIVAMLRGTEADPDLNLDAIEAVSEYFDKIKAERGITYDKIVDEMVIVHQIPGGMTSNLIAQLREQNALDRLKDVLEEVPRVRKDLGYPPLVTPTSQMVGVQAVFNVLARERYKIVPNEVRDYAKGLYGRSPAPIKEEIRRKILGNETAITCRPADLLEPLLPKVRAELAASSLSQDLVTKEEDYISYALFPEVALRYFNWRKDPEKYPAPVAAPRSGSTKESQVKSKEETDGSALGIIKQLLDLAAQHDVAEIELEQAGSKIRIKREVRNSSLVARCSNYDAPGGGAATSHYDPAPSPAQPARPPAMPGLTEPSLIPPLPATLSEAKSLSKREEIKSPMVGTFYLRSRPDSAAFVEPGSVLEPGQTLCIIEAMKLMNEIEAEKRCRVLEVLASDGDPVEYGQVLFRVELL
jgi:oxaloacetate decarboxylase alpha subunit